MTPDSVRRPGAAAACASRARARDVRTDAAGVRGSWTDAATVLAVLRKNGWLTAEQQPRLEEERNWTGQTWLELAVGHGLLERAQFGPALARHLGLEWAGVEPEIPPAEVIRGVAATDATRLGVFPWRLDGPTLLLLGLDPANAALAAEASLALGRPVRIAVAEPALIAERIASHFGATSELRPAPRPSDTWRVAEGAPILALENDVQPQSVVDFVNAVVRDAIDASASDLHFEPFEHELRIRYRIDGVLHEMKPVPATLAMPVASRLKVLAQLDVAERRIAQDGRINVTLADRVIDLRVATLPTQFGESLVLRVLDQSAVPLALDRLGLPDTASDALQRALCRPHGLLIVTGPTGSGKTTTLYSALARLNEVRRKILTVEDPVEFQFEGVMQVPVNAAAGLTFARALRAFLRQDPDVIMVGEIRDSETAQIAVQAALTGHLVLTTMHTNDAPGAVTRLIDLGVEPFLVASALEGVLAQRLVRTRCHACAGGPGTATAPNPEHVPRIAAEGCAVCRGTGYRGRTCLAEWIQLDAALRELVIGGASSLQLRAAAAQRGWRTLRNCGDALVAAGITTTEEIDRYCH